MFLFINSVFMKKIHILWIGVVCLVFTCIGFHIPKQEIVVSNCISHGFLEEDRVRVSIRVVSEEESKKYFSCDLMRMGYQPVRLVIENASDTPYFVSPRLFDISLIDAKQIAKKIGKRAIPRSIIWKIVGIFFWPAVIPSAIDSVLTYKSFHKMYSAIASRALREEVVPAYGIIHRVFFVQLGQLTEAFAFSLENTDTLESAIFSVQEVLDGKEHVVLPDPAVLENYYLSHT